MEKELFDDLLQSLQEAKDIAIGKMPPSRRFEVLPIDVKAVREQQVCRNEKLAVTVPQCKQTSCAYNWQINGECNLHL